MYMETISIEIFTINFYNKYKVDFIMRINKHDTNKILKKNYRKVINILLENVIILKKSKDMD